MMIMPFLWYFVFYLGLLSYLIFNIWSLKEELAGAPAADTEMGAAKPAVAVATATAKAVNGRGRHRLTGVTPPRPPLPQEPLPFGDGSTSAVDKECTERKTRVGTWCVLGCVRGPGSPGPR